ncbi:IclR family transcriptional regulator [Nocardia sp. NBC_00416]|uniref:IclR family transcriptional regulator n=1 Tax=Nocardia sp. NBC_00416 TaxID=2975991 RepID=UPI002E20C939
MVRPRESGQVAGAESGRRVLATLGAFTAANSVWTATELADHLGYKQSTAYRYIGILRETGFLETCPGGGYRLTDKVLALAEAHDEARNTLVEVARPIITRLRDTVDETVLVARRRGDFAFCVDRVESTRPVSLQFDRGQPMALHSGSIPRLLLATMPGPERGEYLDRTRPLLAATHGRLISDEALRVVREAGFSQSSEEIDQGIWGTAALIRRAGRPIAAVGTAAPVSRLTEQRRAELTRLIIGAAEEISGRLVDGY